jgi:hypothetical protein
LIAEKRQAPQYRSTEQQRGRELLVEIVCVSSSPFESAADEMSINTDQRIVSGRRSEAAALLFRESFALFLVSGSELSLLFSL